MRRDALGRRGIVQEASRVDATESSERRVHSATGRRRRVRPPLPRAPYCPAYSSDSVKLLFCVTTRAERLKFTRYELTPPSADQRRAADVTAATKIMTKIMLFER